MSDMKAKGWQRKGTPESRMMFGDEIDQDKPANELDSEAMRTLHSRLLSYYQQELSRQGINRAEMATDEDFYDNIQWTEEDARVLRERGQTPICYNVITTSLNWLMNSQKRMRTDFKILPRKKDGGKQAERKSQLLKYLSDVNRSQFDISRAFEDAVKVGIGWLEDGAQDESQGEQLYSRYESWRNMLWDSAGSQRDTDDWRYQIRTKWVDVDIAQAMFPDRADVIANTDDAMSVYGLDFEYGDEPMDSAENAANNNANSRGTNDLFNRSRIRLIEIWFRSPKTRSHMKGGEFSGEIYDPESRGHAESLKMGASVVERLTMRMHVAIMTQGGILFYSESPYRHNKFPFTPVFGNVRGRDGMPYGAIRSLRDIQEDINKRASKALAILSSNKVVMDEGAVPNINAFIEEVARPDAVITKKKGYELTLNADRELSGAHLEFMSRSIAMIQQVGGITDENMGRTTNATSGVAITARQDQGALATAHFFDNLKLARQLQGEKQLSLTEQYYDGEKEFRITNMRGTPEYITVNNGERENDITATKADFIITESDWNATVRQAQLNELIGVMTQLGPVAPQVVMAMLDLVVESMDISNREELVKRIRAITGQRDPDAEEPTPEEIAAEQAKQQAEQEQAMMQQRMMMADIQLKEANAADKQASAMGRQVSAQKIGAEIAAIMANSAGVNVATQKAALEAALVALQVPNASMVADGILHEAGYVSRSEDEGNQFVAQAQQQRAMRQQEQQARQQAQQQAMMQEQQAQSAQPPTPEQGLPQQMPQEEVAQ